MSWGVKLALCVFKLVQGRRQCGHGCEQHLPPPQMSSETLCHTLARPEPDGPHHIATYGESAEIWEMLPGSDLKWLEDSGVSAASGLYAYLCRTPPSLYLPYLSSVTLGLWSSWPECASSLPALRVLLCSPWNSLSMSNTRSCILNLLWPMSSLWP